MAFLALLATMAYADEPPRPVRNLCRNAALVAQAAEVCDDNKLFRQWATRCLADFRHFVTTTSKAMAPGLARDAGASQSLKLADALGDYQQTISTLESLIAVNRRADQEMNAYLNSLTAPLDRRDLMDVPCIGDTVDDIRKTLTELRSDRASLETTLEAARKNFSTAKASDQHLDASSMNAAVKAKAGGKGAAKPASVGPRTNDASDITGTQREADKQKQTDQLLHK